MSVQARSPAKRAPRRSALIKCECCGGSISDEATSCPFCGDPLITPKTAQNHGIVAIYQLLGCLCVLVGIFVPLGARMNLAAGIVWFGWLLGAALGCFALAAVIQALRQIEYNTRTR